MTKHISDSDALFRKLRLWARDANFRGAVIWLETGVRLRHAFEALCVRSFERSGYSQVALPYILPSTIYQTQQAHFAGLRPYSFAVESHDGVRAGYLRTTSETPFTFLFSTLWRGDQLPFRFVQNCTVFRNELEVDPPLRSVEIQPFIESYTAHADEASAQSCVKAEVALYTRVLRSLYLPFVVSVRPRADTFPEARYTIAFDAVLPDGSASQVATVHELGTSFAKAFNWRVNGNYPFQTSTGISGRALAVCLLTHKKNNKVFLPRPLYKALNALTDDVGTDRTVLAETRRAILARHLRYVTTRSQLQTQSKGVITFPVNGHDSEVASEVVNSLRSTDRCLGFSYPRHRVAAPCIITGKPAAIFAIERTV